MAEEARNVTATNGSEATKAVITSCKAWILVFAPKANDAVEFYKKSFGAEELIRICQKKRKADQEEPSVLNVEMKLGDMAFLVSDDSDEALVKEVSSHVFSVETDDIEAAIAQAVAAGAIAVGDIEERLGHVGKVKDPYGNVWMIRSAPKKSADMATY